eukprot:TRINITY_DN3893_c0_g1_i6.p1 TRINITY_DN3893_c0_g1~~TRINITY_DN3893_c0_g1_i6.p1  ORF type:complete len:222 (-),score=24.30 TRINITY_DN3893_c0_g1_i6:129-794(-)
MTEIILGRLYKCSLGKKNKMKVGSRKHHENFIARFKGKISILGKDNNLERIISMGKPIERTRYRYTDVYNLQYNSNPVFKSQHNLHQIPAEHSVLTRDSKSKSSEDECEFTAKLPRSLNYSFSKSKGSAVKCLMRLTPDARRGLHLRLRSSNLSHHPQLNDSKGSESGSLLPAIRAVNNYPQRNSSINSQFINRSFISLSKDSQHKKFSRNGLLVHFRTRL